MRTRTRLLPTIAACGIVSLALATASCAPEPPPFRQIAGVKLLMNTTLDPAADVIWDSVKSIATIDGIEEIRPETEEDWLAIRNAAVTVGEAGNLLMIGDRAADNEDWMLWCLDLVDAGQAVLEAADRRDPDEIFNLGETLFRACEGCHANYWISSEPNLP